MGYKTMNMLFMFCFFFFSSRRRHTRFTSDWSSDVCSSDLPDYRFMTDKIYRKPIPIPTPESDFFWSKVAQHELWIQRCIDCSKPFFYPRMVCPLCLSQNIEWFEVSGRGSLYSYMINHRPAPGFEDDAPYAIAIVELEEGPKIGRASCRERV